MQTIRGGWGGDGRGVHFGVSTFFPRFNPPTSEQENKPLYKFKKVK